MHLSKKEDQDKVKAWITEPTYRVEKKFAEAQTAPSWHNFCIAVCYTVASYTGPKNSFPFHDYFT